MITSECDVNEEIKLIKLLNEYNLPCYHIVRDKDHNTLISDNGEFISLILMNAYILVIC